MHRICSPFTAQRDRLVTWKQQQPCCKRHLTQQNCRQSRQFHRTSTRLLDEQVNLWIRSLINHLMWLILKTAPHLSSIFFFFFHLKKQNKHTPTPNPCLLWCSEGIATTSNPGNPRRAREATSLCCCRRSGVLMTWNVQQMALCHRETSHSARPDSLRSRRNSRSRCDYHSKIRPQQQV